MSLTGYPPYHSNWLRSELDSQNSAAFTSIRTLHICGNGWRHSSSFDFYYVHTTVTLLLHTSPRTQRHSTSSHLTFTSQLWTSLIITFIHIAPFIARTRRPRATKLPTAHFRAKMSLCRDQEPLPLYFSSRNAGPSASSIASSTSSSTATVWSDVCSQASEDITSASSTSADSVWSDVLSQSSDDANCGAKDESESHDHAKQHLACQSTYDGCEQKASLVSIAYQANYARAEVIQHGNPRRIAGGPSTRTRAPPSLVNQEGRKTRFVDNLVDSSAQIVEAIWPISSTPCRVDSGSRSTLSLRTFIQETLRRSRTSYYTLQVALYYLILVKPHVQECDFPLEQPDNGLAYRALQCGRRMFLAALILASKYLQDRNYSARAWSRISGLNTAEINQNEMALLKAVNFRLHITDAVFQRWTDIVLRYTPNDGPDPDVSSKRATPEQAERWKSIVLKLEPDLANITDIEPCLARSTIVRTAIEPSSYTFGSSSNESTPTTKYFAPNVLEPCPLSPFGPSKSAPALGLLPTPRMTPQSTGFNTPAASATPFTSGRSSMGHAIAAQAAQAASSYASSSTDDKWTLNINQSINQSTQEKWQAYTSLSPLPCAYPRRCSLATSISSASSPESMISDLSSRSSRCSSISSASSLMSAPSHAYPLEVQVRCRNAKRCNTERSSRTTMSPVAKSVLSETAPSTSPESHTGPVGRENLGLSGSSLESLLGKQQNTDYLSTASTYKAARALQDLHIYPRSGVGTCGLKRSRPESTGESLQEDVRELLMASATNSAHDQGWSDTFVRPFHDHSPHVGSSPAYAHMQAPGMTWKQRQQEMSSSESLANTSPNVSNKRRKPSTVKT